jgi:hypothetical protein
LLLLLLAAITRALVFFWPDLPAGDTLANTFWIDGEKDVWTWYCSAMLGACAVALAAIWAMERGQRPRFARYWLMLAILFLGLSIDDVGTIHERISYMLEGERLRPYMPDYDVFRFKWLLVGIPFAALVGLICVPFLIKLPFWLSSRMVLAGAIACGGALGLEMVSSFIVGRGLSAMHYSVNAFFEEGVEQAGIILFLDTLLRYLGYLGGQIDIRFASPQGS